MNEEVDILNTVSGYGIDRLKWLGKAEYHVHEPLKLSF